MSDPVRVLIVEDDPSLRDVLQGVLTARGLQVVASSRGEEALSRAREEPFDLIVADIRMEGISGLDTIEQARQIQPDIGSIVVSGYASEEETLRAVRLNVAGYLKKPFKTAALLELITAFLAKRSEQIRRAQELGGLREALLWSLERQGQWAERLHPGRVLRAAQLARGLSRELGFSGDLPRHLYVGTALRGLGELDEAVPEEVLSTLKRFPLLAEALQGLPEAEASTFAWALCQGLEASADWPADAPQASDRLRLAYQSFLSAGDEEPALPSPPAGSLGLAQALEGLGDRTGALAVYEEIAVSGGISATVVQAWLGCARIAVAQGATALLEKAMSSALSAAEQMGPVTLGLSELAGARLLRRGGHPAARKLFSRAADHLGRLSLQVPWASSVLALRCMDPATAPDQVETALAALANPAHLLEVLEELDALLPDLLALGEIPAVRGLASGLVRDYPQEVVVQLRAGRLPVASRAFLLELLPELESVSSELLAALGQDEDPDLRAQALTLVARLSGQATSLPVLRVYSLGQLDVRLGDQRFDDKAFKTVKSKHLLSRLVYGAPKPVPVDTLMEEFWPGMDESSARNNLNTCVSHLRKVLKSSEGGPDPLVRVIDNLGLNPELPIWHDVDEFNNASANAARCLEAGHLEGALANYSRMARLHRGPYLEGCYMDWALERRASIDNHAIHALEQLSTHRLEQHRYREALEYALRLLALQPDHASAHETVMKAHLGLRQHDQAVEHFEAYRKRLAADYGSEPSFELMKVYQMARYGFEQGPGFTAL